MTILLAAVCVVLCALLPLTYRQARLRARRDTLDALGRSYGIEPMTEIGNQLGWIDKIEETPTGIRLRVKRGR